MIILIIITMIILIVMENNIKSDENHIIKIFWGSLTKASRCQESIWRFLFCKCFPESDSEGFALCRSSARAEFRDLRGPQKTGTELWRNWNGTAEEPQRIRRIGNPRKTWWKSMILYGFHLMLYGFQRIFFYFSHDFTWFSDDLIWFSYDFALFSCDSRSLYYNSNYNQ